jgi:hypothetical protein
MHLYLLHSDRYAKAVQSTTLEKVPALIYGCVGYIVRFFNLDLAEASLDLYACPRYLIRFISYLKARGVGIGQINKHVSLARKVRVTS